jgi:cytochrome P450
MNNQAGKERDYFSDLSVSIDPYSYFEEIRAHGPVYQLQSRDIVAVTGYNEAIAVLTNTDDFSSVITTGGPTMPLPFEPAGDDVSELIARHRDQFLGSDMLVALDGDKHAAARSLLSKLFVPKRLRDNEAYLTELANRMIAEAVDKGECELMQGFANRYTSFVMSDLLGVPAEDRERFSQIIYGGSGAGNVNEADSDEGAATLDSLTADVGSFFAQYLIERRANPRADVLSELANAKFPNGSTPEIPELVILALFLFAAGQDTSAKLMVNSMRLLCENPDLQEQLRNDRSLIPPFVEEVLRIEGSTKVTFRLAKRNTRIGDFEIPAGKKIVIFLSAASHDPVAWENPKELRLNRYKANQHMAFGRGPHTCIGAPLARTEVRVVLDRFLAYTSNFRISEKHHGVAGQRRFEYDPSFIIRGVKELFIELAPAQ